MSIISVETTINVPFYDLDPMNVVWHGNYVRYTEVGRCALLNKIGYNYDNMREDGVMYPVAKMDLKFIKSATLGQKLLIITSLEELEPALRLKYVIKDAITNETLFKATSMQICVDVKMNQSVYEAPQNFKRKLQCIKSL